jgi:hypothetical protein
MSNENQILMENQFFKKQSEIVRMVAGLNPTDDKAKEIIKLTRQIMEDTFKSVGMKFPLE